jgi:UDP-N-acetylglucosamine 1-carboxyvinyltransferase
MRVSQQKLIVTGGARLRGEVTVSGSRAAALPILASSLLVAGESSYRQVPDVGEVAGLLRLLAALGAQLERRGSELVLDTRPIATFDVAGKESGDDAAALLILAALAARCGEARVPLAAAIGGDPHALFPHLAGLAALGARLTPAAGTLHARGKRLVGTSFHFPRPSALGTACLMLAATLAEGRTNLEGCATEPEIEELGRVLNKMGGRVHGAGTPLVAVEGVERLAPVAHALPPDRIEAGTLMLAAALTRGELLLRDSAPDQLRAVIGQLRAVGAEVHAEPAGLRVVGRAGLVAADVVGRAYPGFPGALLPAFMALLVRAKGGSVLSDDVAADHAGSGPGRFACVPDLRRLGAAITYEGATAIVTGPRTLRGTAVTAQDASGAAALLLAGLAAEGTTEIFGISHLDRGYERLDRKLRVVGAELRRVRARAEESPRL